MELNGTFGVIGVFSGVVAVKSHVGPILRKKEWKRRSSISSLAIRE